MYSSKNLPMMLLPNAPGLRFESLAIDAKTVPLSVLSTRPSAACPVCKHESRRLHSHYRRAISDLPWGGRSVRLCAVLLALFQPYRGTLLED